MTAKASQHPPEGAARPPAPAAPPKSGRAAEPALRHSLQPNERRVLDKLAEAWNAYLELSKAHPDQDAEFRHGIHALQHQILARPTRRMLLDEQDAAPVRPRRPEVEYVDDLGRRVPKPGS